MSDNSKIKSILKSTIIQAGLLTGALVFTKIAALYIYKEMKKEGIPIDI